MERSPLQDLSKTFTHSSKVTLPNIRKGLVRVTFPSHLQYLNGSLSKSLRSLKVYFRAVYGEGGGGATKREGSHVKLYLWRGAEKVLAMLKGGGQQVLG